MPDAPAPYRILCLDGGGAKGFYTLGVLREIEAMIGCPIHERFDLIYGTSTGSIIAALLGIGKSVEDVHKLYKKHVPTIMKETDKTAKTAALRATATTVFGTKKADALKTHLGIVATRWATEKPMIFKTDVARAMGRTASFKPFFGCTIADAVVASCSAAPFFERHTVTTDDGDTVELLDGGYCANNPTLYAIADATKSLLAKRHDELRVVSIGVGNYPEPTLSFFSMMRFYKRYIVSVQLLQKTIEINTKSMDQLRAMLFKDVPTVRISDTFEEPEMATDLFEHDISKLNKLRQRGADSFGKYEADLKSYLC